MPSDVVAQGIVEIRVHTTGALWFAEVEAQGSDHLRLRLRPGDVGVLPSLEEGLTVDCAMEGKDGRYCVEAHVLKQDGESLWLTNPPTWKRTENRRSPRIPGGFLVKYACGDIRGTCACLDISAGGMRLRLAKSLPVRSVVDLSFMLPGETMPLVLTGIVLYSRSVDDGLSGVDVGVKFRNVPIEEGMKISRFCGG